MDRLCGELKRARTDWCWLDGGTRAGFVRGSHQQETRADLSSRLTIEGRRLGEGLQREQIV
jgi:hypothetical protein